MVTGATEPSQELRLTVPPGLSLIGNPFATNVPLRSVITNPPEGLVIYTFNSAQQQFEITQFSFGKWTAPDHLLGANEGAYVHNPGNVFEINLTGPDIASTNALRPGFNLIGVSGPERLNELATQGDQVYRLSDAKFVTYVYNLGAWQPSTPPIHKGEGIFVLRSGPSTNVCAGGTVLLNNYVPGAVNERVLAEGCDIVSGPDWKAQLLLIAPNQPNTPLGGPVTFLTGTNSGYVDISSEAIVCVPGVQAGGIATLAMRFWSGNSFEEATAQSALWGYSAPFTVTVGGGVQPPALLTAFTAPPAPVYEPTPREATTFEGHFVDFGLRYGWPQPLRWQKEAPDGSWLDMPGQNNPILTFPTASFSDAGNYRIVWSSLCSHTSAPVTLTVRAIPQENVPGSVDPSFQVRFGRVQTYLVSNAKVFALAIGPTNEIFVGGHFAEVNGKPWNGLARLNDDGSLNEAFQPPIFDPFDPFGPRHIDTHQIYIQRDGTVWSGSGGYGPRFTRSGALSPYNIANVLNANIRLIYPDGRMLVDGNYESGNSWLYRFLPDSNLDPGFSRYTNQQQRPHLLLRNEKILVLSPSLERRLPHGTLDESFVRLPITPTPPTQMIERPNGQVYLAGVFKLAGETNTRRIIRLNVDGSMDTSFSEDPRLAAAVEWVHGIVLQPNGKIVLGGVISAIPGISGRGLLRLNTDGSLDPAFETGEGIADGNDESFTQSMVLGLAMQQDGKILVAGDFQKFDGVAHDGVVRLFGDPVSPLQLEATTHDGKLLELQITGNDDFTIVEQAASVDSPVWQSIATIHLGENKSATVNVTNEHNQSFYRVRTLR